MQDKPRSYNVFGISHQTGHPDEGKFHTHFQYEIFIFYQGKCKYAIGNRLYDLKAGDILIMDGSLMHRPFILDDGSVYDRSIVQFSSEWIRPALKALKAESLLNLFEEEHFYFLNCQPEMLVDVERNIQKIAESMQNQNNGLGEVEIKLEVIQLLLKISRLSKQVAERKSETLGEKYIYIQETVAYIQNNYQNKFSLDDLAEEISISKSYLVHLFKELTGKTIMDYTMSYRLKQAKHMLVVYPNKKSKEIGYQCGFENESHFSRVFKTATGLSPRVFRKTYL